QPRRYTARNNRARIRRMVKSHFAIGASAYGATTSINPRFYPLPQIMSLTALSALSPLDGRYAAKTDKLRPILSEAGFMRHRVKVEIAWLQALSEAGLAEIKPFSAQGNALLNRIANEFTEADAARIKEIEAVTNHDVKA